MNEAGFTTELAELKEHDWYVTAYGEIRLRRGSRPPCPIGAVCYSLTGTELAAWEYVSAADALGLSRAEAHDIVLAADSFSRRLSFPRHVALRGELLDALGLTEDMT